MSSKIKWNQMSRVLFNQLATTSTQDAPYTLLRHVKSLWTQTFPWSLTAAGHHSCSSDESLHQLLWNIFTIFRTQDEKIVPNHLLIPGKLFHMEIGLSHLKLWNTNKDSQRVLVLFNTVNSICYKRYITGLFRLVLKRELLYYKCLWEE